jgi:RNA polymerase sigma-70 factor (ECF subfamily)
MEPLRQEGSCPHNQTQRRFWLNFFRPARNLPFVAPGTAFSMRDPADRLYERLLVLRCQAGDEAAFAELVERYGPRLRYYLRKLLGPGGETEDVLQDVWLDVFRALPRLADPGAVAAWLYRIARDRAWRLLRRRRRAPSPLPEDDLAGEESEFSVADAEAIHAALEQLPPEHREVLVLRFLEEMSYDDIARVVGCPLGTVRSRLHHARRGLRRAIERMNDHE